MKIGVIGGGVNGLVAACYLGRAGHDVSVFEARSTVGGLCVTEELIEGFRISTTASWFGMLRPEVIADLELQGFEPYLTSPYEIVFLAGGGHILGSRHGTGDGIGGRNISDADRRGWTEFWGDIRKGAACYAPHILQSPPTVEQFRRELFDSGLERIAEHLEHRSILDLIDLYMDDDALRGAAATGVFGYPGQRGNVIGCLLKGNASTCGAKGYWGFCRGGMGSVTRSLAEAAERFGVRIVTNSEVLGIEHHGQQVAGIRLAEGFIPCDIVICGTDLYTAEYLLGRTQEKIDCHDGTAKLHLALKQQPSSPALEAMGHSLQGTICLAPGSSAIRQSLHELKSGKIPSELMLSLHIPSLVDSTIAPAGKHLMTVDVHYCPPDAESSELEDAILTRLEVSFPSIREEIEHSVLITTSTLQTSFGLRSNCCWHLPMAAPHILSGRGMHGSRPYRTDVRGVYLCGASTHPGPTVSGANGHNCAAAIVEDLHVAA